MTWQTAEAIADALLYEGYLLYPYRGSAAKNRFRWQFGVIAPRACGSTDEHGPWRMQTECLFEPGVDAKLDLKLRFLQVESRTVERLVGAPDDFESVQALTVDGRELVSWDEAGAREIVLSGVPVSTPSPERTTAFRIDGGRELEIIRDGAGAVVGRIVRERWPMEVALRVAVEQADGLGKVRVVIENVTPWSPDTEPTRPAVLRRSLVSAHTLLALSNGGFVSLIDPPAHAAESAARCTNLHTWPVLVGEAPRRDLMLSAPVILYDYPAVAPESPGDLFDGTEIDEILTLRVLTLTDEERREARATDPRAREIIERTSDLPREAIERLHGAIRYLGEATGAPAEAPAWEEWLNPNGTDVEEVLEVDGKRVAKGTRVRLRPAARADAMDMFLAGQAATVAAVYRDLEDRAHIAVVVDAEGAADLHEWTGRYYYFGVDEVEVLDAAPGAPMTTPSRPATRVLVAGIGNMFLGDDGFGPAVIQRLAARALPEWVKVEDFGIRSVHLAYDMLGASPPYEITIIIDAVARGGAPGTLYVLDPGVDDIPVASPDAHTLSVEGVLGFLRQLGGEPGRVLIVGCEAASVDPEMGLSAVVADAVDGAADLVMSLLARVER